MRPVPLSETELSLPMGRGAVRGRVDHIILLDGTFSSLREGEMSNVGLTWQLLAEGGPRPGRTLYYEEGIQWQGWRRGMDVVNGIGLEGQIRRAYGHLASHYRDGDRIYLFGYSRGAFAVRSLAGVIDRIGLLRQDAATERNVTLAWRHYRNGPETPAARAFAHNLCHPLAPIEMLGVWDTVKALGLRLPLLWMLTNTEHEFHNHQLGAVVRHGFHALALDETRAVFEPLLWHCPPDWTGHIEQVWFRGAHGDIGGQLGTFTQARPLSNIPLVWMLSRAEACGLSLPQGWRARFPCDPHAPMVGTWRLFGKWFLMRRRRQLGRDPSERIHESVPQQDRARWPTMGQPAE
ncbi:DUF2235 domain-containing protein [Xinfangfangia sp. CPCC 101601]|uniref:DUF2235 domain-containing protein n=1 Tax=Pseudogemmobacter lacusdianii TaxID=3069608 RepID=A0ABU0W0N2_9RHOB|nr:DUF2235 domain-containing protein [Xinfangfangia sp. CPCC 101601]MDQ2067569.1 DUF2235 domain-containing protein [Xinfangfangia sp. CPCC 101601]